MSDKDFRLGEVQKTSRGFGLIRFYDSLGTQCSLQQSSAIGDEADAFERPGSSFLWLGTADGQRMSLSRDQVAGLIDHLKTWHKTGSFGD